MNLCLKYLKKFTSVIGMGLILSCLGFHNLSAQEFTSFKNDFGGIPISCSISIKQVAIDGISAGEYLQDVREKLGTPDFVIRGDHTLKYNYYGGLLIYFIDLDGNGNYTVYKISSMSKTGCTPDGVSVGMPDSILSDTYGTADRIKTTTYMSPKLSSEIDASNQKKLNETTYIYYADAGLFLSFTVKNGIITMISICQDE